MKINQRGFLSGFLVACFSLMVPLIWSEIPVSANAMNDSADVRPGQGGVDDEATVIATIAGPIQLGASLVRLPLTPAAGSTGSGQTLAERIKALGPNSRLYLVVKDLSAVKQPGIFFDLYLNLPPNTQPRDHDPHYVGTINFYNASRSARPNAASRKFFSFDVTALARDLQARGLLNEQTTVTIYPVGPPNADSRPAIGQLQLVGQ